MNKEASSPALTHLVLQSGDKMPTVGVGLWKVPQNLAADLTYDAIKSGYRLIDEARVYGNELECGLGINKALNEGLVKREELWVTSKLWNNYHRKEHVKACCMKTLSDLGLKYLDLYLIHFPIGLKYVPLDKMFPVEWKEEDRVPLRETWEAMEELVAEGLVRNIGISNFGISLLRDLLSYARIKPSVIQIEVHPYASQNILLKFCKDNGVAVTAYSPLGGSSYLELGMSRHEELIIERAEVKEIAKTHGKSPAQVVLRWALQHGTSIVVKSNKSERMKENLDLFGFELSKEEIEKINSLNINKRFNDTAVFAPAFPIFDE